MASLVLPRTPPPAIAEDRVRAASRLGRIRLESRAVIMAALVVAHVAVLGVLIQANIVRLDTSEVKPLVVELLPERTPPPVAAPAPDITPVAIPIPKISAPEPIVVTDAMPVSIAVVAPPPAPAQTIVTAARAVQPAGPVSVADLSATMIEAVPPRYPVESRRRREQGAVVLMVLLRPDGGVENISVSHSSGFERLDKAALDAVRRWRWSPTLRGGEAMAVRGIVEIPFVLKG